MTTSTPAPELAQTTDLQSDAQREPLSFGLSDTLVDAEHAHMSVGALVELLHGCPPDYPLSAGLFLGLVVSVKSQLDNVVDGLRVASRCRVAA